MSDVPMVYPLEWHPAYRDKTWLLDWLNGDAAYPPQHIRIPLVPSLRSWTKVRPSSSESALRYSTLTKYRCAGPAPYVGRPFLYEWIIGVDELGRGIANDSVRRFIQVAAAPPMKEQGDA